MRYFQEKRKDIINNHTCCDIGRIREETWDLLWGSTYTHFQDPDATKTWNQTWGEIRNECFFLTQAHISTYHNLTEIMNN